MFSSVVLCDDNDYTIDRIDWEKLLNKNTHVSVENLYGNILIKKSYIVLNKCFYTCTLFILRIIKF